MGRHRWILAIKVALGAALIVFVSRSLDMSRLTAALAGAKASAFLVACLLMAVGVALNSVRWRIVMKALGHRMRFGEAALATFELVFFQQLAPAGVGGDIARGVRAYDNGIPASTAAVSVIVDRGLGLLFVAETLIAARFVRPSALLSDRSFFVLFALAVAVVGGAALAVALGAWLDTRSVRKLFRPASRLLSDFSSCMRTPIFVVQTQGVLALSNVAYITSFAFCAEALGVDMGWWDALIVVQGLVLASLLPISIGGWGVRESAALILFQPLGVGKAQAVGVSVLFGLVLTALAAVGAAIWFLSGYRRLKSRKASQDRTYALGAPLVEPARAGGAPI